MARLKPHLIMCNLHRSKLDANRPLTTAAEVWKNAHIFLIFTAMMNDTEFNTMFDVYIIIRSLKIRIPWGSRCTLSTTPTLKAPRRRSAEAYSSTFMVRTTSRTA